VTTLPTDPAPLTIGDAADAERAERLPGAASATSVQRAALGRWRGRESVRAYRSAPQPSHEARAAGERHLAEHRALSTRARHRRRRTTLRQGFELEASCSGALATRQPAPPTLRPQPSSRARERRARPAARRSSAATRAGPGDSDGDPAPPGAACPPAGRQTAGGTRLTSRELQRRYYYLTPSGRLA